MGGLVAIGGAMLAIGLVLGWQGLFDDSFADKRGPALGFAAALVAGGITLVTFAFGNG